jgi:hypothetical protein
MCVGISAQTKIPVHVFDLGQSITEQMAKTFPGIIVTGAWKVNTNSIVSYEIRMVKGNMEYALQYDKDGKFLRKDIVSPVIVEKKVILQKKQPKREILLPLSPLPVPDSLVLQF